MKTLHDLELFLGAKTKMLAAQLTNLKADGPMVELNAIVEHARKYEAAVATINETKALSEEGKRERRDEARKAALLELEARRVRKAEGIDAHLAIELRQHLAKGTGWADLPEAKVAGMLSDVRPFTPDQRESLYRSGTTRAQVVLEAAAKRVPLLPASKGNGQVGWVPLIAPAALAEVGRSRAAKADPDGAALVADLELVRDSNATVYATVRRAIEGPVSVLNVPSTPRLLPTE